jgi:hypothetical protein
MRDIPDAVHHAENSSVDHRPDLKVALDGSEEQMAGVFINDDDPGEKEAEAGTCEQGIPDSATG